MEESLKQVVISFSVLVGMTTGLTQLSKQFGYWFEKWAPWVAMIWAMILSLLYVFASDINAVMGVFIGIAVGLSANGLYSGGKHTISS